MVSYGWIFFFFFFQAEDGIRDLTVTGVQTCALPIWWRRRTGRPRTRGGTAGPRDPRRTRGPTRRAVLRARDRKSTRLNSSHSQISYAVFCLKKKKQTNITRTNRSSIQTKPTTEAHSS